MSSPQLMTGGSPYGVTNDSLNADVESGLGKARASAVNTTVIVIHKKVVLQVMTMMLMLSDKLMVIPRLVPHMLVKVRGGYAPVTVTPKTNMCGGKKKRRRKNKSRKSRRKSKKGWTS